MTVEKRLEKLERENKWMRRAGAVVLAVAATVLLTGQGKGEKLPDLEVRSLTVKDEKGKVRVKLGTATDGSAHIEIHDQAGRVRLSLRTAANGAPHLRLADQAGKHRAVLRVFLDGSVFLALHDGLLLRTVAKGSPSILLTDGGRVRTSLGIADAGSPALELKDAKGNVIWQVPK